MSDIKFAKIRPADAIQTEVVVTDIQMPFVSMVFFMVKWSIAAIPAALIIGIPVMLIASFLGSLR